MNLKLTKKQILSLSIFLVLVLVLPLTTSLLRKRQEIRKRAAGTGDVRLILLPSPSGSLQRGQNITFNVRLTNLASANRDIRVAGAEVKFDKRIFNTPSVSCGSALSSSAITRITDIDSQWAKVELTCYVPPGATGPSAPLPLVEGTPVVLGNFNTSVKADAPYGVTQLSFVRTNVPLASSPYTDLSDGGTPLDVAVSGGVTPTATTSPRPTISPTPPVPTSTPRPTVSPTPPPPTPTGPTSTPGACPDGEKGNINCDSQGLIDEIDLDILIRKWSPRAGAVPSPEPGNRSADLNGDGYVDEIDLDILIRNWRPR